MFRRSAQKSLIGRVNERESGVNYARDPRRGIVPHER
jgi:hypothetical protein